MEERPSRASLIREFLLSSIGKKIVMALTGLILFVFVIGHMLGNLQLFLGPEMINSYAFFLKSKPGLLWSARLGLLFTVIVHIAVSIQLSRENQAARPLRYAANKAFRASYASRTMLLSGLIIFSFVIYHLLHFSVGATNPEFMEYRDLMGRHDVYRMMVAGFSHPWVSFFYILSIGLLCLHLSHGAASMFFSVGLQNPYYRRWISGFGKAAALVIFIGNCSIPIAILMGYGQARLSPAPEKRALVLVWCLRNNYSYFEDTTLARAASSAHETSDFPADGRPGKTSLNQR